MSHYDIQPTPRHRRERHCPEGHLTLGDGFRIGLGIAFWQFVFALLLYMCTIVGFFSLARVIGN